MRTGYVSSGSQFDFVMRTGWTGHPGVKCFKYDNRIRMSSGCHYEIKLRTGFIKGKVEIKNFY